MVNIGKIKLGRWKWVWGEAYPLFSVYFRSCSPGGFVRLIVLYCILHVQNHYLINLMGARYSDVVESHFPYLIKAGVYEFIAQHSVGFKCSGCKGRISILTLPRVTIHAHKIQQCSFFYQWSHHLHDRGAFLSSVLNLLIILSVYILTIIKTFLQFILWSQVTCVCIK